MERRSRVQKRESAQHKLATDALNRRIELHTCRQHHTMLRHLLSEFPASEPLPGAAMLALLSRLKTILYRHLKLEDDYVYPALSQSPNEALRSTAREYRVEMGGVMRAFEDFDARFPHAEAIDANPKECFEEWRALRKALEMRMDSEDQSLYPDAETYFNSILRDA